MSEIAKVISRLKVELSQAEKNTPKKEKLKKSLAHMLRAYVDKTEADD